MENSSQTDCIWIGGPVPDLIQQSLEKLAEAPDDDLQKLSLAFLLLINGDAHEASLLARQICVEDDRVDQGQDAIRSANEEICLAIIRSKPMIEARTREFGGPEGAKMVLEQYEKVVLELRGK